MKIKVNPRWQSAQFELELIEHGKQYSARLIDGRKVNDLPNGFKHIVDPYPRRFETQEDGLAFIEARATRAALIQFAIPTFLVEQAGPWRFGEDGLQWITSDEADICEMAKWDDKPGFKEESMANAKLLCAAPDLLYALNGLLEMYVAFINSGDAGNWNPEDEAQVKAARAAIAKATT